MKSDVIPYTHWAYFPDQASAQRCAEEELGEYVIRVREPLDDDSQWLLLAGRDVAIDDMVERHGEVEAIVIRHGGAYDYGEATYLDGEPVVDPMLTGEWPAS